MSFHPRMYAKVSGVCLAAPPCSIVFEDMAVDSWTVETDAAASGKGNYVSMHPRLTIVLDGAHLRLATQKDQEAVPASLIYVPGGTQLWATFDQPKPFRHVDIHIKAKALSGLLKSDSLLMQPVLEMATPVILSNAAKIADRSREDLDSETRQIAIELLQAVLLDARHEPPDTDSETPMARVKTHIERHLAKPLHLEELAAVARLSRTQFKRQFRAKTGLSARQWIIRERIERAKSLIASGYTFAEVAGLTGFSDQAHLNRTFKSVTGLPPGRWAAQSR